MSGRFGATSSHSSAAPQSRGLATDWPSRRRDYVLEDRYADGDAPRMLLLAEELVRLKPDVIVTATTPGVLAAKQATASIPIVAVNITDAVGFGLAASEARPGANVTGILFRVEGLTGKLVEIAAHCPSRNKTYQSAALRVTAKLARRCRRWVKTGSALVEHTISASPRKLTSACLMSTQALALEG